MAVEFWILPWHYTYGSTRVVAKHAGCGDDRVESRIKRRPVFCLLRSCLGEVREAGRRGSEPGRTRDSSTLAHAASRGGGCWGGNSTRASARHGEGRGGGLDRGSA